MKSILILGGNSLVQTMFEEEGFEIAKSPREADALVFTGGGDVNPALYGETRLHKKTRGIDVQRDAAEQLMYSLHPDKLKIGICRGAQFLCVMNGHRLWQNVDGHTESHWMQRKDKTAFKDLIKVTSTHHQMMRLSEEGDEYDLIATAWELCDNTARISGMYDTGSYTMMNAVEPEIVYFPNSNSLCVQGHPEYTLAPYTAGVADPDAFRNYFFELVNERLN